MKKIEWQSVAGINYKIEIGDGSNSVTTLTPAVRPFVLNTDEDNDLFRPIRTQSGNIQIVADSVDIDDVIGQNPFARPVTLYSGNTAIWYGYLQGQAFTQTWDKGPNTISLPVTSPLGVLSALYPSNAVDDLVYISFADFLTQLVVNSQPIYWRFVFPADIFTSDSFTTDASNHNPLRMKFNMLNYASWNSDTKQYDVDSYYDILEDIARLFGFQIVEKGTRLCFLWADKHVDYISLSYDQMAALTSNPAQTVSTITQTSVAHPIWNNDHTMTFVSGKRKVRAVNTINELDDTIYSLDITGETFGTHENATHLLPDGNERYCSQSFITDNTSVIYPRDSNVNIKFEDYKNNTDTGKGCCIVRERVYTYNARTGGGGIITADTGWVNRILFRIKDLESGTRMFTIKTPRLQFYNGATQVYYLTIKGNVMYAESRDGEWKQFTGYLPISVAIGNASGGTELIGVKDGKIIGGRLNTYIGNQDDGFNFPRVQATDHLTIRMLVPNDATLTSYGIDKNYYYSIDSLEICYNSTWNYVDSGYTIDPYKREYLAEHTTNVGFEDEYEIESSLFVYHYPPPLAKGLILANNIQSNVTTLYGTQYPEYELADRLYAYYQQTRKKLTVVLKCEGDLFDPWQLHKPGNATGLVGMSCLSQQIDFANDTIEADLFDIS